MNNYKITRIKYHILSYLALASLLAFVACSSNDEPNPSVENIEDAAIENAIKISATQFESSEMKLGKLAMKDFHEVVKANGVIDVPPQNQASVSSYFGGNVQRIKLLTGERVKKGQVLFTLENPEYVQIQQEYLAAKGQLVYLKSDYERQKNLMQDNVSSQKSYLKAESDYTVTRVKVESLSKMLMLMNVDPNTLSIDNMRTTINILSPIDGFITEVNISRGVFLSPSQVAVTIVDTDHLHLELNVFEKDHAKIKIGQPILFRIQEDYNQDYEASVYLINKAVDEDHRTIGIHGHLVDESLSKRFNPGMYVEASIYTTSASKASLPLDAVIEAESHHYVLVLESSANNDYVFTKREVKTGELSDGYIEILNAKDFDNSATFLVSGAFNLITE